MGSTPARRCLSVGALVLLAACGDATGDGASSTRFGTTLARMPVNFTTVATMSGGGAVTAERDGDRLLVEGTYEGLQSPATAVWVHRARPGLRGDPVVELELDGAESGSFGGVVQLDEPLRSALEDRELYVQLRSTNHPDGVLRGWLFPR